jgi:hypothetical protein
MPAIPSDWVFPDIGGPNLRFADRTHISRALEHPKDLRPYCDGGEKQAQRGQRDRFFQD